jgi:hypothetical protein
LDLEKGTPEDRAKDAGRSGNGQIARLDHSAERQ